MRGLQLLQQRKRECLNSAVLDGCVSAGISLAVAGGLSYWLRQSSPVSDRGGVGVEWRMRVCVAVTHHVGPPVAVQATRWVCAGQCSCTLHLGMAR